MARSRSGPFGGFPKTLMKAWWYSGSAAIFVTAASRVGCPISTGFNNRERSLLLERPRTSVPELRFIVQGIQDGRRITLADASLDSN
jgi:hypothetical protein